MKSDFSINEVNKHFSPGRFAIFLALLIFANFPGVLLGSHTFYFRDYLTVVFPYAQYNHDSFWRGEFFPLWNPLNHCGVPYLAQWQTFVLYPVWWLFLPFAPSWSLGVFMLVHLFFAGLTMYFLARRWTGSRIGACLAGVIYTFNGMMQNSLTWPHIVAALAWTPLVILLVEEAWKSGGRKIVLASLAGAMQMLTGAPEQILFTWFILLVLIVVHCFQRSQRTVAPPAMLLRFALVIVIVAALAAAQLLPFLDLMAHSQRGTDFAGTAEARPGGMTWSVPGWGWANLFVPLFYNFPTPSGVYFQSGQYLTSSYYLGLAALFFCGLAAWRKCDARWLTLGGIFLFSFILALGENGFVYDALQKLFPPLGFMRYPAKFMFLASIVAPLLAAYGASHFLQMEEDQRKQQMKRMLVLCGILLLIVLGVLWFAKQYPLSPGIGKLWPVVLQNGGWRLLFLALTAGALGALLFTQTARFQLILASGIVILCWLDLQTQSPVPINPTTPRWTYDPGLVKIDPRPKHGESRALVTLNTQLKFLGYQSPNPTNDVLFNRFVFLHECNLIDGVPVVGGTHTLLLPDSDRAANLLLTTNESRFHHSLADFLGVSQLSDEKNLGWKGRPTFLPVATAGQRPVFADAKATFAALANPSFNPRETVFLPPEAEPLVKNANPSATKILSARYQSARIDLKTESDIGGWVVLAQSFHHNWKALVNGQPAKIWKANYGFQALEVSPGLSEVKIVYEDKKFFMGAVISILTLIGCVIAWFAGVKQKAAVSNE